MPRITTMSMSHSSSPTSSKPWRESATPQRLTGNYTTITRDTAVSQHLVGNFTQITRDTSAKQSLEAYPMRICRDLGYNKWESSYRYLLSMPHLTETCVSEGSGYKWMLVRKHKDELDCTVEPSSPNKVMLTTDERYIQQYWKDDQLLKEVVFRPLK